MNESENILITVNDNPDQGACSIANHFEENWRTGEPRIDAIETKINRTADADGIIVSEKDTGNVLHELPGQKGLLLGYLADWFIAYLDINVTR